ncbi:hypothetical protein BHE97_16920 [Aeromicrobium sp. PE09-221]|uniref:hypothetical protein n=1 Tax=Aeromicrobium sp. PE09-221 TaxID=1898043 RepID=UPI000B3EC4BA|nr:hypothetical protein [Aeromicrobium sp. PE09-221]OUZ07489.1 hypothetical protein BHE97_16920 [Aeromicrobium sp. PE09-221]
MSIKVSDPALSMQLGAARVAAARREIAAHSSALRASLFGDDEQSTREHYRYDADTRRILTALERLEAALDHSALAQPFLQDDPRPRRAG